MHQRTVTGYAQSECQIALLSAEDIAALASRRPQVRRHVKEQREKAEKFLTRRKCKALFGKIDSACQPLSRANLTLSQKLERESD